MNGEPLNLDECRATWREEAHRRAVEESKQTGLENVELEIFIRNREADLYAELEKLGQENL